LSVLVLISGCISNYNPPVTPPTFLPGIWDKPVFEPPANYTSGEPMPFIFTLDINRSTGFIEVNREYGTYGNPVFTMQKGDSATVSIQVESHSNTTIYVSGDEVVDLPEDVNAAFAPSTVQLHPNEKKEMTLQLSGVPSSVNEPVYPSHLVKIWMKGEGWRIGEAFILNIASP
jgi:hypothetical protein